jgi:hypothetical protein
LSRIQALPSLFLVLLGSMDCLTTVIGTLYFGTLELNPLVSGLVTTNLPAFIIVKLTVTVIAGLTFVLAEKSLMKTPNKNTKSFKITHNSLKLACIGLMFFLVVVVVNNILVIIQVLT